jgi:electron transfer flavoprotein alpha subunit
MADILALVEHGQGQIRDVTFEVLTFGRKMAEETGGKLHAVLLGHGMEKMVDPIKPWAHRVIVADDPAFENYTAETYQAALSKLIGREKPYLTILGHSSVGMGLGPSLGTEMDLPFSTDCLGLERSDDGLTVIRQMYDGKLNARVKLRPSEGYVITLRSGTVTPEGGDLGGEVVSIQDLTVQPEHTRFIEYIEPVVGDVDITKADVVVGIGRGIKEDKNLPLVEEFADAVGGVVACSRPIADAEWLPKDRLVGSSGKTIKPKLYIAIGISGSFQHLVGMRNSATIIAINKDPNAPIFNDADYGIVGDLFQVIPALRNKVAELKA